MTENLALAVRYAFDLVFKATILFAVTTAALFALRRKSAAIRQLVAALGLAGVLALPAASLFAPRWEIPLVPNPVPLAAPPARAPVTPAETWKTSRVDEFSIPIASDENRASLPDSAALPIGNDLASNPGGKYFEPDGSAPKTSSSPTWWMFGTLALWSAGTLIASTRLVLGAKRVAGIRRRASEVGENWTAISNELARKLGLTRPVRLLFSGDIAVPVTAGLRRPVILLPEAARRWNEERRRVVLLHELAHVRRRDWMALLVGQAAAALYWFHPLAWSIRVQMQKDCERSCDDLVLASGTRPSAYAAHLLSIIRSLRISRQRALTAVAMAHRSYWDGRMRAILDPAVARRVVSGREARLAAAGLVIAVALLAVFEPWAPDCAQAVAIEHMPYSSSDPGVSGGKLEAPCPNQKKAKVSTTADTRTEEPSFFHADSSVTPSQAATAVSSLASEIASEIAAGIAAGEPGGFARAGWKERRSGGQWFSRGMELHNAERYDEAIGAFGHSIEEGYRVDTSMYNIACGYARKGDAGHAVEWLRKSLKEGFDLASHIDRDDDLDGIRSDPGFVELRRNLRAEKVEASRNRADRLVLRFVELQDAHSTKGSAFYAIGKELLDVGRYDVAAQAFQASAARGYREGASLYNTACALSLGENRRAALDYLQKALDAGFDDVGLLRRDDDLDNVRGEARYRDLLRMAEDLELHGSDKGFVKSWAHSGRRFAWRETEKHYVEYTQRHPESGRAWFNLGYARLEGERPEAAVEALQRALDLHYRAPTTMYNLACAYSLMDRKDEAFAWLFKALDAGFDSSGMLRSDDDLDNLRGDPRYRQALARAKALGSED